MADRYSSANKPQRKRRSFRTHSRVKHLDSFSDIGVSGQCRSQCRPGNFSAAMYFRQLNGNPLKRGAAIAALNSLPTPSPSGRRKSEGKTPMSKTENKELLILRAVDFAARKHHGQKRIYDPNTDLILGLRPGFDLRSDHVRGLTITRFRS